ncbi:hypothetical protein HBI56_002820 [Parastagonospora nodorum]|uniref:Uncharacterized protein n=1 Tax=Phaeosphaeria nodorum (strain SN15 / ATCC MYA-4574 / FGSC 10173) TaxID=321614 RepID=A0A7U2EQU7_PHANO|nr:hypothetical protein HBH56_138220 [Parastagonospora nodorum]QRC91388.1 hypothetical protein JI435_401300 [Parastagonospora nodorum SN15]KAH3928125.1 hypothetical protein HBH54_143360 [Parastagonospora nodorum]KAH3949018.1 hypothetical protein HBH53_093360 [Parastagonospora nodorum]KAH3972318.1 hypothetical protein HBH52_151860 [Parastagonospora nodorum]
MEDCGADGQPEERQARENTLGYQEPSKKARVRREYANTVIQCLNGKVEEAARAHCGTRQGAGQSDARTGTLSAASEDATQRPL